MSKFSRFVGQGEPIEIDGEQFMIKPLSIEYIPLFFKAMKGLSGAAGGDEATMADMLSKLDDESMDAIKKLIEDTLKLSFPEEWKTNPEELRIFGLKYMGVIIGKIFEINTARDTKEVGAVKKAQELARLKALQTPQP